MRGRAAGIPPVHGSSQRQRSTAPGQPCRMAHLRREAGRRGRRQCSILYCCRTCTGLRLFLLPCRTAGVAATCAALPTRLLLCWAEPPAAASASSRSRSFHLFRVFLLGQVMGPLRFFFLVASHGRGFGYLTPLGKGRPGFSSCQTRFFSHQRATRSAFVPVSSSRVRGASYAKSSKDNKSNTCMSLSAVVAEKRTSFTACFRCISCSRFLCSCHMAWNQQSATLRIRKCHHRSTLHTVRLPVLSSRASSRNQSSTTGWSAAWQPATWWWTGRVAMGLLLSAGAFPVTLSFCAAW